MQQSSLDHYSMNMENKWEQAALRCKTKTITVNQWRMKAKWNMCWTPQVICIQIIQRKTKCFRITRRPFVHTHSQLVTWANRTTKTYRYAFVRSLSLSPCPYTHINLSSRTVEQWPRRKSRNHFLDCTSIELTWLEAVRCLSARFIWSEFRFLLCLLMWLQQIRPMIVWNLRSFVQVNIQTCLLEGKPWLNWGRKCRGEFISSKSTKREGKR